MRNDPNLPADLTLARIATLVEAEGAALLRAQPSRTLGEHASMQACFARGVAQAAGRLAQALQAAWPAIPFVCTADDGANDGGNDNPTAAPSTAPLYWLCDPIDGAVQYLSGLPSWSTSLCLMAAQQPLLAVIHEPAAGRTYEAWAGRGARCNGAALAATAQEQLQLSIAGTSFPNYPQRPLAEVAAFTRCLNALIPRLFAQRWMGPASVSLAQVGAGMLDAYWELGGVPDAWQAGLLVAREAGARISALDGGAPRPGGGILATSPGLHAQWLALLAQANGACTSRT